MKQAIVIQDLSLESLREIIHDAIEEKMSVLTHYNSESSEYLTRKEAANLLRISLPTLQDYTKKGLVTGMRIGNRVLYCRDQVEASLKEIQTIKNRRA